MFQPNSAKPVDLAWMEGGREVAAVYGSDRTNLPKVALWGTKGGTKIAEQTLPEEPDCADATGKWLVIAWGSSEFCLFRREGRDLHRELRLSLRTLKRSPITLALTEINAAGRPSACSIVRLGRSLSVLNLDGGQEMVVAHGIEALYAAPLSQQEPFFFSSLPFSVLAVSSKGLSFLPGASPSMDSRVCSLVDTPCAQQNLVLGVSTWASGIVLTSNSSPTSKFMELSLEPLLPDLLSHYRCSPGHIDEAVRLLETACKGYPSFLVRCTERLLSLESGQATKGGSRRVLSEAPKVLTKHPFYLLVRVRLLRKADPSELGRLSRVIGTPMSVAQECLAAGRTALANFLLLLVHSADGLQSSLPLSLSILKACFLNRNSGTFVNLQYTLLLFDRRTVCERMITDLLVMPFDLFACAAPRTKEDRHGFMDCSPAFLRNCVIHVGWKRVLKQFFALMWFICCG